MRGFSAEVRTYALKLLGYRSRSRKEMYERLKRKGFENKQIRDTLKLLEDTGLIKDEVLAVELFRYAIEKKHLGKKGIEMFLFRRGIERELINETLSTHTGEMEMESALELVKRKKRLLKNYPEDIVKRRLQGMLYRRGVSIDTINTVLKSMRS